MDVLSSKSFLVCIYYSFRCFIAHFIKKLYSLLMHSSIVLLDNLRLFPISLFFLFFLYKCADRC